MVLAAAETKTFWVAVGREGVGPVLDRCGASRLVENAGSCSADGQAMERWVRRRRWSKYVIERRGSVVCTEVDPQVLELCVSRLPEAKCVLTSPSDERRPAADGDLALPLVYEVAPVTNAAWFPLEARRALGRGAPEVRLMDDTALTAQAATVAGGCGAGQVALLWKVPSSVSLR